MTLKDDSSYYKLFEGQFYESALTDHKNAFPFITKTHEKCIKTHGKSLQKRIDLKTEDADRWLP